MSAADAVKAKMGEKKYPAITDEDRPKPVPTRHTGTLLVDRTYKENSVIVKEEHDGEQIEVRTVPPGVPLAKVGFECSITTNMDNFESVRLQVSVELPCLVEEVDECYGAAKALVDTKLNREVEELKEYRAAKRTES